MSDAGTTRRMNVTSEDGRVPAQPGYDHGWFAWDPLPHRPQVRLPGDAKVAACLIVDLGAAEWEDHSTSVPVPGGRGLLPPPDFPRMSHREFGHRVGVFRLLEQLRRLDVPVAAAVDVLTVEHYGPLVRHLVPVVDEFLAAGLSASRPITSRMSPDEEAHYVEETMRRLERALPARPTGWLGAGRGESTRTPEVLAEAGLGYVADWCNDDQPYRFDGAAGLWSFPLSWELDDSNAMFSRQVTPMAFARTVEDAVDVLTREGEHGGRVLGLHVHPWLMGQAFRASAFEQVLTRLASDGRVWLTTPGSVVDLWRDAA